MVHVCVPESSAAANQHAVTILRPRIDSLLLVIFPRSLEQAVLGPYKQFGRGRSSSGHAWTCLMLWCKTGPAPHTANSCLPVRCPCGSAEGGRPDLLGEELAAGDTGLHWQDLQAWDMEGM